jgi:hypothetical protein
MGAGQFPSGAGPAGFDPVAPIPDRPTIVQASSGKKFDPFTKTWPIDENGFHVQAHWLDTWVVTNLHYTFGSIPSAQNVGNKAMNLTHIDEGHIEKVKQLLMEMLSPRVQAAQLQVVSLKVEVIRNTTLIALDYRNLLTGETQRPRVEING